MRTEQIGTRGSLLTFDDDISLYLISGSRFHLLCDTHLGSESMDQVSLLLSRDPKPDQVLIFNSHSDWDHIWGNGSFPDSLIIGHESCRRRMKERGVFDLIQNASLTRGRVELIPPNLTFSDALTLEDEGIRFCYTPGHTSDSSTCYDQHDRILYLGDLVEDPIPYLDDADLDRYLSTLDSLLNHQATILVSAHSGIVTRDLIKKNIAYIQAVRDEIPVSSDLIGTSQEVHLWNLNMRMVHRFESVARERFAAQFSLVHLLTKAGDLHVVQPEHLAMVLEQYLSSLQSGSLDEHPC